jgi:hypothetical protein
MDTPQYSHDLCQTLVIATASCLSTGSAPWACGRCRHWATGSGPVRQAIGHTPPSGWQIEKVQGYQRDLGCEFIKPNDTGGAPFGDRSSSAVTAEDVDGKLL